MCVEPAQPLRFGLREAPSLRRRHDDRQRRSPLRRNRVQRPEDRIGLQDHPRPAPIRHIVHDAMPVGRVVAQVADLDVQRAPLDRAPDDAGRQRLLDHRRKDRDDVYSHHATTGSRLIAGSLGPITHRVRLQPDLVHLNQPLRRIDDDPFRRRIDRPCKSPRRAGSALRPPAPSTTSRLPVNVPSTSRTAPTVRPSRGLDPAPDQIVPVERARRQRRQPLDRHAQFLPRQRLGVVHRVDARDPDDRPLPMKPRAGDRQRLHLTAALDEQLGAG